MKCINITPQTCDAHTGDSHSICNHEVSSQLTAGPVNAGCLNQTYLCSELFVFHRVPSGYLDETQQWSGFPTVFLMQLLRFYKNVPCGAHYLSNKLFVDLLGAMPHPPRQILPFWQIVSGFESVSTISGFKHISKLVFVVAQCRRGKRFVLPKSSLQTDDQLD